MLKAIATFIWNHPIISGIILNFSAGYYLKRHGDDGKMPAKEDDE